ncbi:hypothetical protein GGU11DRAFT_743393 [Lentinula aff. detonsa]|nr:hypothetical protein GGU11DRAFT_743393 [Lentinula aff. detonsa]
MGLSSSYEPLPQLEDVEDHEKFPTTKRHGIERFLVTTVLLLAALNLLLAFTMTLKVQNLFGGIVPAITGDDLSTLSHPDPYIGLLLRSLNSCVMKH